MSERPDVAERLERLRRLHPRRIDLGLGRVERVLAAMGNPQSRLGRSVHVAGTNGKGSTVAYLRAFGAAQGWSVNSYVSPHLVRFNERVSVHGAPIGDAELIAVLDRVEAANGGEALSFFEATTAAMFAAFADRPADLSVIEVGLGGRFDATNVFVPSVSVITPVALDHAEFLGTDLAGVAGEKAGIVKAGVPVVCGPQERVAMEVVERAADLARAPLSLWGRDFRAHRERDRLVYEEEGELLDLPLPALHGDHQIPNAGTAIRAARVLGVGVEAIAAGLRAVRWPARMQALRTGVFAQMVADTDTPGGGELWLDGGHNPHAARALATFMAGREAASPRPLVLVMGILANKDAGAFLDAFSGLASGLVSVAIADHASLHPAVLAELAEARGMTVSIAANLSDAVQRAVNMGEALSRETVDQPLVAPRVLICGSLYLAGQVLAQDGLIEDGLIEDGSP